MMPILNHIYEKITTKRTIDEEQKKFEELVDEVTSLLEDVDYYNNASEDLYNNQQKQIIFLCKELLHKCEQSLRQQTSKDNFLICLFNSQNNVYKEMLQNIEELRKFKVKLKEMEIQSVQLVQTVLIPKQNRIQTQQTSIYSIRIVLKLSAPKNIQQIFFQNPLHLKNEYVFKLQMELTDSQKHIWDFQRQQFIKVKQLIKDINIFTLSKKHCTLEMRNSLKYTDSEKVKYNNCMTRPEINSQEIKQDQNDQAYALKMFLVVIGKNGLQVIRKSRMIKLNMGEDYELMEKDQIVLMQDQNSEPLISYSVKKFVIQQL
ncbi:unnamed protein product [Paramecium sonneborni]|uniref:Uncharacterized protein n=1 Tax=Paramecium sonneborni TaxID=65129 RepID=A0A8S1RKU1_9CILI|nr:unnamed protein product [Paramecium sonneborni]